MKDVLKMLIDCSVADLKDFTNDRFSVSAGDLHADFSLPRAQ